MSSVQSITREFQIEETSTVSADISISLLIASATAARTAHAEKGAAFGQIVRRFQDMAFACAYAVLGDFYLAEDAAQESFITAWRSLDQLRKPEAFPGWFKRIVLKDWNSTYSPGQTDKAWLVVDKLNPPKLK